MRARSRRLTSERWLRRGHQTKCAGRFDLRTERAGNSQVGYQPDQSHSHLASGVCRKNEFLCANSVMLCVSVVKLPGKTSTTEARSLHREPRRTFSDRLLKRGVNEKSSG